MRDFNTIVYHGDCPDGFCAAFVASKCYPGAQHIPATYGKPIDDAVIQNRDVLVVDFSWKKAETQRIASLARYIRILDHHKTAEAELAGLPYAYFDMNRSGAQLAWDHCFPAKQPRPWYVDYVADRDLWRWQLPESKTVSAYLMALPHTIEAWAALDSISVETAIANGRGARAQVEHYVDKVTAQAYSGRWNGHTVAIVNAPYPNISDVANQLCERGAQIGLGWFMRGDMQIQFSLRSIGDLDVSTLAKEHGGGGHKNASGFQIPMSKGLAFLRALTRKP